MQVYFRIVPLFFLCYVNASNNSTFGLISNNEASQPAIKTKSYIEVHSAGDNSSELSLSKNEQPSKTDFSHDTIKHTRQGHNGDCLKNEKLRTSLERNVNKKSTTKSTVNLSDNVLTDEIKSSDRDNDKIQSNERIYYRRRGNNKISSKYYKHYGKYQQEKKETTTKQKPKKSIKFGTDYSEGILSLNEDYAINNTFYNKSKHGQSMNVIISEKIPKIATFIIDEGPGNDSRTYVAGYEKQVTKSITDNVGSIKVEPTVGKDDRDNSININYGSTYDNHLTSKNNHKLSWLKENERYVSKLKKCIDKNGNVVVVTGEATCESLQYENGYEKSRLNQISGPNGQYGHDDGKKYTTKVYKIHIGSNYNTNSWSVSDNDSGGYFDYLFKNDNNVFVGGEDSEVENESSSESHRSIMAGITDVSQNFIDNTENDIDRVKPGIKYWKDKNFNVIYILFGQCCNHQSHKKYKGIGRNLNINSDPYDPKGVVQVVPNTEYDYEIPNDNLVFGCDFPPMENVDDSKPTPVHQLRTSHTSDNSKVSNNTSLQLNNTVGYVETEKTKESVEITSTTKPSESMLSKVLRKIIG